jgi:drug/metabolite transporter (DMT)-like permease
MSTAVHPAALHALNERLHGGIGVGAVLAATVCWSTAGVIAVKADARGLPLTFWRVLIVGGLFGLAMLSRRRRLTWWAMRQAAPAGALFGLTAAMFFEAVRHTSVRMAPSALTRYGHAGSHAVPGRAADLARLHYIGAVAGVALFVAPGYRDASTSPRGLILASASMLTWVVYLFITKRARRGIGTLEYMTAMNLSAAVLLGPLVLLFDNHGLRPPTHGWLWILLLAVLPGFSATGC